MVQSDWGDWFVHHEIEAVEPDGLSIWFIGCNGFVLRSPETTVYIDPYFGGSHPPRLLRMAPVPLHPEAARRCDGILVTHEHIDHMHPPSFQPLVENTGAEVYAPRESWAETQDTLDPEIMHGHDHVVEPGDKFTIGDLTIHVRGGHDPDARGEVTYVIEHAAGTFFHGGDTRYGDTLDQIGAEFDIDLGVLAMGSEVKQYYPGPDELVERRKVYMDHDEVIEAANALAIDRLAPSHYRMWKEVSADPSVLHDHAASFAYPRIIEQIEVGDRLEIATPGIVPRQVLDRE